MLNGTENCLIIHTDDKNLPTMKEIFDVMVANAFIKRKRNSYAKLGRLLQFKLEDKDCEVFYCNDGRIFVRSQNPKQTVTIYNTLKHFEL